MSARNPTWLIITSLIVWLIINFTSVALADVEDIDRSLFHDGARWRGEDYVRAREVLVGKREEILPFLMQNTKSADWRERCFAEILISRINNRPMVDTWHNNLMSLVREYKVLDAVRDYRGIDWEKLPSKKADVPASHIVDVLWEYRNRGSSDKRVVTAAGLQFYLAPDIEALDAVMEAVPLDHAFRRLALHAIAKLGDPAIPRMREELEETIAMQPSTPWDSKQRTKEQDEEWNFYYEQTKRTVVSAYVLAQLNDKEAIPLIAKCLSIRTPEYEYTEALSGFLAEMKAVEAVDVMLDWTLRSAVNRCYKAKDHLPGYTVLRSHVISLGPEILPALRDRLKATDEECEKIVLTNLIAELSGVKGKEKEVAELRETIWFDMKTADLLRLHELTGEDVFPSLSELAFGKRVLFGRQRDERVAACLALGTLKEIKAVPLLAEEIRKQHENLEKRLGERQAKEDAKLFDPQKAREAGYTFGRQDTYLANILTWGDTCLLALRRIGGDEAKQAVTSVAEYPEYKIRVDISLLLMNGKIDEIAKRLQSQDRAIREEAALALLESEDEYATYELLCAAARRHGPSHDEWKGYALSSCKDIIPALRELIESDNVREQVLGAAMIIEIESPEKAEEFRDLLYEAALNVSIKHVIDVGTFEMEGRKLANQIDESCVPLVEAACLFGQGIIQRGIAAYALAEFKKPRSMYVLEESFNMGSWQGSNPAALALADYGEKGAEIAAKVPPPTPGEYDTGLRMTEHRAGVQVLAEIEDIRGVEEILKGLETLEIDKSLDNRDGRMRIYLDAAGRFHEKQLVEPLLRILETSEKPERYHHEQVIELLSAYDDDRLVPQFTESMGTLYLNKGNPSDSTLYGVSVTALTRQLGEDTPEYLIKQYKESKNSRIKAAALLALGELSYPDHPPYPGKARWSVNRFKEKEDRVKVASKTRNLAYPVLIEALNDPSAGINRMAALGLTILSTGNAHDSIAPDLRAVGPLTEWLRREKVYLSATIEYLGNHGNKETGEFLVVVLKSQPPAAGNGQIVYAIEKIKPDGAVPILVRNIKARANVCKRWYMGEGKELQALSEFGTEGADSLFEIFNSVENLAYRIEAARLLGEVRNEDAAKSIKELLSNVIEAGPDNPKLIMIGNLSREETYKYSCEVLLETLARLDVEQARMDAKNILLNGPEELKSIALKVWIESK